MTDPLEFVRRCRAEFERVENGPGLAKHAWRKLALNDLPAALTLIEKLSARVRELEAELFAIRSVSHKISGPDDVGAPTGPEHNTL